MTYGAFVGIVALGGEKMESKFIGNILKTTRKELNLSVKTVLGYLHEFGIDISDKTLYGWENNHRQPDADTFLVLCRIYGIDSITGIQKLPPLSNKIAPCSDESVKIAADYDNLDNCGKRAVRAVLEAEKARCTEQAQAVPARTDEDIEQKVEEYRRRLILEKNQAGTSSPSSGAGSETA